MLVTVRHYNPATDYERVNQLLLRTYRTTGGHISWTQMRWEYMHYHPLIRNVDLNAIGVWEAHGRIVGVAHPEHHMGEAFFEIDPEYDALKRDMLIYAEQHLSAARDGQRQLQVLINNQDTDFQRLAAERGYADTGQRDPMACFVIPHLFPSITLPAGFRLKSLADDNDLRKVDRVLWRGFNHDGEPPEDGPKDRAFMQSAPNYRKDLNIVVEAPDGNFVSYCGMWYDPMHAVAYVEPVATDPDYRRMGLGRAAVLEGIRRCGALGATEAWVGSALPFYQSLGFRVIYASSIWQREWTV